MRKRLSAGKTKKVSAREQERKKVREGESKREQERARERERERERVEMSASFEKRDIFRKVKVNVTDVICPIKSRSIPNFEFLISTGKFSAKIFLVAPGRERSP